VIRVACPGEQLADSFDYLLGPIGGDVNKKIRNADCGM